MRDIHTFTIAKKSIIKGNIESTETFSMSDASTNLFFHYFFFIQVNLKDMLMQFAEDTILNRLNINYKIKDVAGDGDCFYHALADQLDGILNVEILRKISSNSLIESDTDLLNAIYLQEYSLQEWKKIVQTPKLLWADHIVISALTRSKLNIAIIIIDDEFCTLNRIQNEIIYPVRFVFLRRSKRIDDHYQSVVLTNNSQKKLINIMKNKDTIHLPNNKKPVDIILLMTIIMPLIVIFKFLNRSL